MMHFCTYCDQGYAAKLLCLYDSLREQGEPFRLHVLCFDAVTESVVNAIGQPSLVAISLRELLTADPAYAAARESRSAVEFYFTSTPVLVRYCLQREPSAEQMTYLDSDLFFFAPPSAVFQEQGQASVGIVPHRFPAHLQHLLQYGTYNVAWVSFRRDQHGEACLEWWRERCLEWCHDYVSEGRYADQGYLDGFPKRFGGVRVVDHPGINAAPWNVAGMAISEENGNLQIGDKRILFFHFQGVREVMPGWFDPGLRTYRASLTTRLRDLIYLPYLRALVSNQERLRNEFGIRPRLGYQRLSAGTSWRDKFHRFAVQRLLPKYRRWRGHLLHCPTRGAAAEARVISTHVA
jgi:hypothetical protein